VNASRRVLALIATAALAASITVSTGAAQANTKAGTNTATETGPPTDSKVLDLPITASGSLAGSVAQNLLARQPNLVRNPYSLLIEFAAGADPESVLGLLKETNTRLVQQFSETNVYQLETTGDLGTIRSLLARDDQVLWVDFDNIVSATATKEPSPAPDVSIQLSNDSMASQLWGLFGSNGIRAEAAWAATASVQDVVIAVIDSGVMIEHPDLAANIWTNPGEIAGNGIDDDNNGFVDDLHGWDFVDGDNQPNDLAGHGTHVAGTIAAVRDNGIGVAGVAHNAKIMPIRFLDANGQGFVSDALSGLDYALRNGAKVSNNSWGGGAPSSAFSATLDRANSEGHLFVASAGNESTDIDDSPSFPASYPQSNILSVASLTSGGQLSSFSNFGTTSVDIAAPGSSIRSTYSLTDPSISGIEIENGAAYISLNGTSMAAPHVSGIASLLYGLDPTLTPQQVIELIIDGGRTLSTLNSLRWSKTVDAEKSIALLNTVPPSISISGASNGDELFLGESVTLTATASSSLGANLSNSVTWRTPNGVVAHTGSSFTFTPTSIGSNTVIASIVEANGRSATTSVTLSVSEMRFRVLSPTSPVPLVVGDNLTATWAWPGQSNQTGEVAIESIYRYEVEPNSSAGAIVDNRSTSVALNVGESFLVGIVSVGLRLSHSYVGDLTISLTSPSGERVNLYQEDGGSGNNFGSGDRSCDGELTIFTEAADDFVSNLSAPYLGPVRASESLTAMENTSANGQWVLTVTDNAVEDTGTIHCVELDLTNASSRKIIGTGVPLVDESFTITHTTALNNTLAPESRLVLSAQGFPKVASLGTLLDATKLVPTPPRQVVTSPNGTPNQLRVSWIPPLSRGGGPVTGFQVREGDSVVCQTTSTSCFVGLYASGSVHSFTVTASNSFGTSIRSDTSPPGVVPTLRTSAETGVDCYMPQIHDFLDVRAVLRVTNDVGCISQLGITTGTSPTAFSPNDAVLREQMAAFLARLNTKMIGDGCSETYPFTDVSSSSYAAKSIGCLSQLQVTRGTTPTTFAPKSVVTREQMAAFLARYYQAITATSCTGSHPFTDIGPASYAYTSVGCIYELGITTGTSPTTFSPKDPVTREQMASFLARIYRALTA